MSIPIRNLYFLFSYAWRHFPPGGEAEVGIDACPDTLNLFGRLLANGLRQLERRGLDRQYREFVEETRVPRGKMLMDATVKEQTLTRGAVVCSYDDLTEDVLHNQLLKTTALRLRDTRGIDRVIRSELGQAVARLGRVSTIRINAAQFRRVQLSRNTRHYGHLLRLCELVHGCLLPEEGGASYRFADILRDQAKMEAVFEEFLRSFYALEQTRYSVKRERLYWEVEAGAESLSYVPMMETDITMRAADHTIIVDAKYYSEPFSTSWGTQKLHASNLYQLTTYLRHEQLLHPSRPVSGVLIYPASGTEAAFRYRLSGHDVRIEVVDFDVPWRQIHNRLLGVVVQSAPASALSDGNAPKRGRKNWV